MLNTFTRPNLSITSLVSMYAFSIFFLIIAYCEISKHDTIFLLEGNKIVNSGEAPPDGISIGPLKSLDFQKDCFRLLITINNIKDVYSAWEKFKNLEFLLVAPVKNVRSLSFKPFYAGYHNTNEIHKIINLYLEIPIDLFQSFTEYKIETYYTGKNIGNLSFSIIPQRDWQSIAFYIPPKLIYYYNNLFWQLIFMTCLISIFISLSMDVVHFVSQPDNCQRLYQDVFNKDVILLSVWLFAKINILNYGIKYLILAIILIIVSLPWSSRLLTGYHNLLVRYRRRYGETIIDKELFMARWDNLKRNSWLQSLGKVFHNNSMIWLALSLVILVGFSFSLFKFDSFRWAIFEERDFLVAKEVAGLAFFPTVGPQLLAGGQTPGGLLYLILAPITYLGNDPTVFSYFNKILFVCAAIIIWVLLRVFSTRMTACLGVLLFCSSKIIVGLSYWPIHPSMSIVIYFIFLFLCLRGIVDGSIIALAFSGMALSVLVQFHFSYYLLIPAYIILLIFGRQWRTISLRSIWWPSILFIIPLIPYIISDAMNGFSNLRLIFSMPRFHNEYVPIRNIADNFVMVGIIYDWMAFIGYRYIDIWKYLFLFGLISLIILLWRESIKSEYQREIKVASVLSILFTVPFVLLFVTCLGYNDRHTLPFAGSLFIITALGVTWLLARLNGLGRFLIFVLTVFIMVNWIGEFVLKEKEFKKIAFGRGEWAVNYNDRETILKNLITKMGITQEQYREKIYWYWLGWAASPEIYEVARKKYEADINDTANVLKSKRDYLFLLTQDQIAAYTEVFNMHQFTNIGEMRIFKGELKDSQGPLPRGNAVNRMRLGLLERSVENLKVGNGLYNIELDGTKGFENDSYYLLSINDGRIKILLRIMKKIINNHLEIAWTMESPALNGYYQEIKTIYKPSLLFIDPKSGNRRNYVLIDDVVGNLIYKTPLDGKIIVPAILSNWRLAFCLKGWFDQSNMENPIIGEHCWDLEKGKILKTILPDL